MRLFTTIACLLYSTVVSAQDSLLIGSYTHEFTRKNEVVWAVKMSGKKIQLITK